MSEPWIIGRKNIIGHTLCSGKALREYSLSIKLEGCDSMKFKKVKYSSQLLFNVHDSGQHVGKSILHGRFPGWLCDFLVPLLREGLVVISGHVCYDIGPVSTFQDIALTLHILITKRVFTTIDNSSVDYISSSPSVTLLEEAFNRLLVWLSEGEAAVITMINIESIGKGNKILPDSSASNPTGNGSTMTDIADIDEPDIDTNTLTTLDVSDIVPDAAKIDISSTEQPVVMTGVTMRRYQLQALNWMLQREKKTVLPDDWKYLSPRDSTDNSFTHSDSNKEITIDDDDVIMVSSTHRAVDKCNVTLPREGLMTAPISLTGKSSHELWVPIVAANVTISKDALIGSRHWELGLTQPFVFWWNSCSQKIQSKPVKEPASCRGGILADEMGMGKTVMALALIASDLDENYEREKTKFPNTALAVTEEEEKDLANRTRSASKRRKLENNDKSDIENIDLSNSPIHVIPSVSTDTNSYVSISMTDKKDSFHPHPCSTSGPGSPMQQSRHQTKNNYDTETELSEGEGTLIVCPMSLLGQWMAEIQSKLSPQAVKAVMYYGPNRESVLHNFSRTDVIVTSYGTLMSEARLRKQAHSSSDTISGSVATVTGILGWKWRRVILDEAHVIKNPLSEVARAAWQLQAPRRWVITGTPIQNSLNDLFSLVKFLGHEPWDQQRWWKKAIGDTNNTNSTSTNSTSTTESRVSTSVIESESIRLIRSLLAELMIRRTKNEKDESGRAIVELPEKDVHIIWVDLSAPEREFYEALMGRSRDQYQGMVRKGTVSKGYAALFTLLMRLRQACDHPMLVLSSETTSTATTKVAATSTAIKTIPNIFSKKTSTTMSTSRSDSIIVIDDMKDNIDSTSMDVSIPPEDTTFGLANTSGSDNETLFPKQFMETLFIKLKSTMNSTSSVGSSNAYLDTVMQSIRQLQSSASDSSDPTRTGPVECPICLETPEALDCCVTPCGHFLCIDCAHSASAKYQACPVCMHEMTIVDCTRLADGLPAGSITSSIPIFPPPSTLGSQMNSSRSRPTVSRSSGPITKFMSAKKSVLPSTSTLGVRVDGMNSVGLSAKVASTASPYSLNTSDKESEERRRQLLTIGSSKLKELMAVVDKELFSVVDWKRDAGVEADSSVANTVDSNGIISHEEISGNENSVKIVIFSQWTSMLDVIEDALRKRAAEAVQKIKSVSVNNRKPQEVSAGNSYGFCRLDGSMSQSVRDKALLKFMNDSSTRIILISLRAGGVGLNLTTASVVIMTDPWWNPAIEDQAIDRVHRIGQTRAVRVYRLLCKDTVEEKLLKLQEIKRSLTAQTMNRSGSQQQNGGTKLTLEDLKAFFTS